MRKTIAALTLVTLLSACGSSNGIFTRSRPNEMAVTRAAPLVVPPDFGLAPPAPGTARAQEADSSTQALQAMFGGPAARSATETRALQQAGQARATAGIRSNVGDPDTNVADKGAVTRDIIAAPEGDGQDARATTPKN
jgi:Protein of unknown function (DUF3035)